MDTRHSKARRKLLKESDLDASIKLLDAEDDEDTVAVWTNNEAAKAIVDGVYAKGRHRKWSKAIRQHHLGDDYFDDSTEVSKLAKVIVAIKSEIVTAGLENDVFNLDNPALGGVQRFVNELVYDTLTTYIAKPSATVAYGYLVRADSASSDRDGRSALIDLIKGKTQSKDFDDFKGEVTIEGKKDQPLRNLIEGKTKRGRKKGTLA
ncbi:hypothetical protein CYMTET_50540 [Cymbomonas tetramitiformis]|uniref:Uncharacterized protein n=1 Tax=Cymbomonas tetramitiformis TaxID=36881 RepID=A0AAE0BMZ5_9CHLO|nr:hypothetical protein CYMTET_50540 [Cymbomonas tetramitiformis]